MKFKHLALCAFLALSIASAAAVDIDGKISPGEYSGSAVLKDGVFTLYWQVQGDRIHLAIDAVSQGWVSIGLDPTAVMANSDMVFGLVGQGADVKALDCWSSGTFGPHPADTDKGGKNDILAFAGTRSGNKVVFEFTRLLDTKDKLDKAITPNGTMKVIWATGRNLVFTSKHDQVGSGTVTFKSGN